METKRLILALGLSFLILFGWRPLAVYLGWAPEIVAPEPTAQNSAQEQSAPAPAPAPAAPATPPPSFVPTAGRLVTVDTPLYKAVFHSNGGVLRSFALKKHRTGLDEHSPMVDLISESAGDQAPLGVMLDRRSTWSGYSWALEGNDITLDEDGSGVLRFVADIDGVRLTRELLFSGSDYTVREKLRLSSPEARALRVAFTFSATTLAGGDWPGVVARLKYLALGGEKPAPEVSTINPTKVAWFVDGSFDEDTSTSDNVEGTPVKGQLSWMGVMNNYFMGAVSMDDAAAVATRRHMGGVYHVSMGKSDVVVSPGGETALECVYFLGPKEGAQLEAAPNNLGAALDYGFFSIVARPLVWLLKFLYGYVHNYGVAIILMTVLIKIIFWPLSQKSYKSMQQMKQLQPMMAKLREKYSDDKEAMNREIMQLYKTYKVNPASGCLPILVQIPVFFGLYQALLNAIELRHAPFVSTLPFTDLPWLADLSAPDPYFITPLVMGASMLLQQKLTPTPGDPTQAKVMMFMPVIFTALFLGFSSGLVVYWLVNNVISIGQQWWQLRRTA